jgi:flagellar protein FliO/FliZ
LGGEKLKILKRGRLLLRGQGALIMAALFIAAGLFFNPSLLSAQELVQEETVPLAEEDIVIGEAPPPGPGGGASSILIILRMVLVLALAALAIYGVVFFIKRMSRPPEARDPHLKVLAKAPLSGGAFAAVVSVGSKAWLVGGGDGGVSLIAEIDETEALESMLIDDARKTAEAGNPRFPDFRSLLKHLGGGRENRPSSHAESLRKQRDRLKGL